MDKIRIEGGTPLNGVITISGAKNAALPLMAASLLTGEEFVLTNVPSLADIASLTELLQQHGATISRKDDQLTFSTPTITSTTAPYEIVRKMRASVLVLGPLMSRCHEAIVSLPGGCAIGTRPVDLHIKGLEAMGATIKIRDGYIHAKAEGGLKGADYRFPMVTVGGTENILMAATLATGTTRLYNAAKEPEVTDLANCLVAMGAQIEGIGTSQLTIHGVEKLGPATHKVLPDRIETGTYMVAAAITGGKVDLLNTSLDLLPTFDRAMAQTGVDVTAIENGIRVDATNRTIKPVSIETHPFPGIATDLQAQFMALMCTSSGTSTINETIFENRFMHVPELARMGADIMVNGPVAEVTGVKPLKGAPVMATDLRASVSLVLAGLAAKGVTEVNRVYHLDRGYESIEVKLSACGANIKRISDQEDIAEPLKLVK